MGEYGVYCIYVFDMWVRTIGQKGPSTAIVLPAAALRALCWERGDFIRVEMTSTSQLLLTKFNPATVPASIRKMCESVPIASYA